MTETVVKVEPEDEPDEWLASQRRITALKSEIIEEEVRIRRLGLSRRRAA